MSPVNPALVRSAKRLHIASSHRTDAAVVMVFALQKAAQSFDPPNAALPLCAGCASIAVVDTLVLLAVHHKFNLASVCRQVAKTLNDIAALDGDARRSMFARIEQLREGDYAHTH